MRDQQIHNYDRCTECAPRIYERLIPALLDPGVILGVVEGCKLMVGCGEARR